MSADYLLHHKRQLCTTWKPLQCSWGSCSDGTSALLHVLTLRWSDKLFYLCFSDNENEFTSFAMVAMKTAGRAVAISDSPCLADRWVSADGDNGKPFLNVRSRFLLSAESSNNAIKTAETSIYGSQRVNPRPIRSMAARLTDVCAVSWDEGGLSKRYIRALPVRRTVV